MGRLRPLVDEVLPEVRRRLDKSLATSPEIRAPQQVLGLSVARGAVYACLGMARNGCVARCWTPVSRGDCHGLRRPPSDSLTGVAAAATSTTDQVPSPDRSSDSPPAIPVALVGHRVDGDGHGEDESRRPRRARPRRRRCRGPGTTSWRSRRSCGRRPRSRTRGRRCCPAPPVLAVLDVDLPPLAQRGDERLVHERRAARRPGPRSPSCRGCAAPGSGCGTACARGRPRGRACCAAAGALPSTRKTVRRCRPRSSSRRRSRPASGASGSARSAAAPERLAFLAPALTPVHEAQDRLLGLSVGRGSGAEHAATSSGSSMTAPRSTQHRGGCQPTGSTRVPCHPRRTTCDPRRGPRMAGSGALGEGHPWRVTFSRGQPSQDGTPVRTWVTSGRAAFDRFDDVGRIPGRCGTSAGDVRGSGALVTMAASRRLTTDERRQVGAAA